MSDLGCLTKSQLFCLKFGSAVFYSDAKDGSLHVNLLG